jgi:hypothetical protein
VPKEVSEVSSGGQFSRSSNEGQLADSQTRSYKIIKSAVDEVVNIQEACQVRIGDQHPFNTNLYCVSFDARFEGDSRLVIAVTFNYQTTAGGGGGGQDPKSVPPDVRPAGWTTSSSLIEVPVYTWTRFTAAGGAFNPAAPKNAAGDRFDAIARYEPVVTISVQHFEPEDPTNNVGLVGVVNHAPYNIGSLRCEIHTIMLRGISSQPVVESWNDRLYKGWTCTYEFAYRKNTVKGLWDGEGQPLVDADIGWDIAVPETGFNVLAFNPAAPRADQDIYGQPLRHNRGKIVPPLLLPDGVDAGDRVRAMVKVFDHEEGGTSQLPSAQPVPLNEDGTPRKSFGNGAADPPVIIKRYLIYEEYDFTKFALRGIGN